MLQVLQTPVPTISETRMASIEARAFWTMAPGRGEIRTEIVPDAGPEEVRIRTLYTAISRGTERLVFTGAIPATEFERMRAPFQEGQFPGPVKYGYSNVGVVEQGPEEWLGRLAFCLYPHQTQYVVPIDAVYALPSDVPAARAVLAANLETALNGLWDASPARGSHVTVIGAGSVGCLVAWLARTHLGARVQLTDIDPAKARVAAALGLEFALADEAEPGAHTLIHTSGQADGLRKALTLAAFEATIIEMSWYGTKQVALPLGEAFHSQRLTLRSSQVGTVAPSERGRITARQRMMLCLAFLAAPELDELIDAESPFDGLPEAMEALAAGRAAATCHRIVYS